MTNGRHSPDVSRGVKSQMGRLLNRVRENSRPYDEVVGSDLSDQGDLQYYESDEYLDHPLQDKWEVRYDNQNYIRSLVNEDRGLHRTAHYPKQKWQISYDDHSNVRNLAPYPVRVSIDHGDDDVVAQWDIPYDNKNYVLSMLAGTGISKTWDEELNDRERDEERHGDLRNPYDYSPQKDEVMRSAYRETNPRRESYRFDRVERNVHDYETESVPEDEPMRPHPRQQRRRSTNIYRYGDVERNVHDYAGRQYSRSPPRYGRSPQEARTRYDAINKWKRGMQNSDHEAQNAYNEELERHFNQYGVEASAHDYDENRAIRPAVARKRIVPMSVVNIMRKHGNKENRHLMQVAENYRDHFHRNVPRQTDLYERPMSVINIMREPRNKEKRHLKQVAENYRDHFRRNVPRQTDLYERVAEDFGDYDYIHAPGNLYEDVLEEHRDHPQDYCTTQEDRYEQYMEDDDSQTWVSANEKYAEIHHRPE